ncbi:MAG: hypothetical protein HN352_16900 [Bacteroidetes bacterium]|jgi:hypothetical protein|nr:hypothetical protein [Bacteroidota bacterium]MBT4410411.1 hypothetical protein [Bacteroidota bacterium]MBT7464014.1 hypothetical protein [Bacteroidota bacterium]
MFFKESANTKVEEIRKYIPVSVATSFANVSPLIGSAESKYILPLLGQSLYNQVHAYYIDQEATIDGITQGNKGKFDILIEHVQRSLINLTYYSGFEFLSVSINDSGFHRQESESEKSLFKYQEEAIKNQFKDAGFNGLDTMLEFIESNPSVFPLFSESASYTLRKESIIPSTRVFDSLININESRLVFLKIKRFITEVEDFDIKAALGGTLFDLVKTEIVKQSPAEKIAALLPYIQKPLAHLALSKAFRSLGIHVRDRGVFFLSQESTMQNSTSEKAVDRDTLSAMIQSEKETGEFYLATLREFLVSNASIYTEIVRTSGNAFVRDNSSKTSFWS